jgi:hypothetical protein
MRKSESVVLYHVMYIEVLRLEKNSELGAYVNPISCALLFFYPGIGEKELFSLCSVSE